MHNETYMLAAKMDAAAFYPLKNVRFKVAA